MSDRPTAATRHPSPARATTLDPTTHENHEPGVDHETGHTGPEAHRDV